MFYVLILPIYLGKGEVMNLEFLPIHNGYNTSQYVLDMIM